MEGMTVQVLIAQEAVVTRGDKTAMEGELDPHKARDCNATLVLAGPTDHTTDNNSATPTLSVQSLCTLHGLVSVSAYPARCLNAPR